nr:bacteriocin [Flavobacterium sp. ASV13]
MKSKTTQSVNTAKATTQKSFTLLSKKQLQTILGGEDPKIFRGTKTSAGA